MNANITITLTKGNKSIDFELHEFVGLKRNIDALINGLQAKPDCNTLSEQDKKLVDEFLFNAIARDKKLSQRR